MLTKLESLKGLPQQIEPVLRVVGESASQPEHERWKYLHRTLGVELQQLSLRHPPPKLTNLVSAQALPSAERLGLIEGKKSQWKLSYEGRRLLDVAASRERFKLRLARIILDRDEKSWSVVEALRRSSASPGAAVAIDQLALALGRLGVDASEHLDGLSAQTQEELGRLGVTYRSAACRLSDMLQFYDWVDLVRFTRKAVTLSPGRVIEAQNELLEEPPGSIPMKEFVDVLSKHYFRLRKGTYSSPFVPIRPALMDAVCDELRIGNGQFTQLLSKIQTVFGDRQFLLSSYRSRREPYEVVRIGQREYYYLSIYPSKKEVSA